MRRGGRGAGQPRAGAWERFSRLVFRLYPGSYRRRHGPAREALTREMLEAEPDPRRRSARARRVALDALGTLPRAWGRALTAAVFPGAPDGTGRLGGFGQDLRHSLRSLLRQPAVPAVAVLSIALGIGFNASLFSAVNALVLRPPAGVAQPERVVEIGRTNDGGGFNSFSYPDLVSLREGVAALEHLSAWRVVPLSYGGSDGGERVVGMAVSAGYFEALGAAPSPGRAFLPEEDVEDGPAVAVVSERFWRARLEADPRAIGRVIQINRVPVTVVGVAPAGFRGHFSLVETDVWLPFERLDVAQPGINPEVYRNRGLITHQVVARLSPGATLEQASASVAAVMAALAEAHPDTNRGRGAAVARLGPLPGEGAAMVKAFLGLLMGLVTLILLAAVANVAGMLLARAAVREREIAIRLALGSGRARLARQLVVETLLLALAGAAGGMLLASWATSLITTVEGPGISIALDLRPDATVFAFAVGLALLTGLLLGGFLALQTSRPDLLRALRHHGGAGATGTRARRVFVTVQVAVSVVLLAAGGLLVRSLGAAARMSGGFDPAGVHLTSLDLSLDGYSEERVASFQETLRARLLEAPGVEAAALALDLPLDLSETGAPVWPDAAQEERPRGLQAGFNAISPGYFETLRIPLLAGRDFGAADAEGGPRVVIVSQALARRAWGEADPLGRTVRWMSADDPPRTVVGVVGEVKNQTLGEAEIGMVYLPLAQRTTPATHVLARGPAATGETLRRTLLAADPRLALSEPQTLEAVTAVSLLPSRVAAAVTGLLGALALFLSSLGVYGVVAHAVAQRRREIGVRVALGARAHQVLALAVAGGSASRSPGCSSGPPRPRASRGC